ncbi:serine/threonine-protein kinase PknK, partial [candidate division CSSED10-310 bacterium]
MNFELGSLKTLADGQYVIEKQISKGGMGIIIKGFDQSRKKPVAIKLLLGEVTHGENIHRFRREYQTLKMFNHPNIVTVYDFIEMSNYCLYVMEFVDGKNLQEFCADFPLDGLSKGAFDDRAKKIMSCLCQVCDGLTYIHNQGVIHRDVKPSNIMITTEGQSKLMDFGLVKSREFSISLTKTGIISGTVAYMSPEQAMGKNLDIRTDIYSLGVVLYEIFTNTLPFYDENPINLLKKHVNIPPKAPCKLNPLISSELNRIILKCLNKDPQLRFQVANTLKECLIGVYDQKHLAQQETDKLKTKAVPLTPRSGNLLQPQFVGRAYELEMLTKQLKKVEQGGGHVVIIRGAPGIGKTRLVEEMKNHVLTKNLRYFHGIAYSRDDMPYKAFTEIVEQFAFYASLYDPETVSEVITKNILPVNEILNKFSEEVEKRKTDNIAIKKYFIENRNRILELFLRFFRTLATKNPLILFIDNLHLGDENSLFLFHYLAKHLSRFKIMLIGAYRTGGFGEDAERARTTDIHDLLVDSHIAHTCLDLGGLSIQQTSSLIRSMLGLDSLSPEISALIFHHAHGNPAFAQETLNNLLEEQIFTLSDSGWVEKSLVTLSIPEDLKQLINLRLNRLSDDEWRLLSLASVLGNTFDAAILLDLQEDSSEKGARLIFDLCQGGFIAEIPSSSGDFYAFRHEETRHHLYTLLSDEEKKGIHLDVLEIMLNQGQDRPDTQNERLFYHALHGEGRTLRTAYFARVIGDRYVQQYALQSARYFYEQAREILAELESGTVIWLELFTIYQSLARLHHFLGNDNDSIRSYFKALELAKKLNDAELIIESLL